MERIPPQIFGGNKFRLIAAINYKWQVVYIREIFTHADCDKGVWL
jgi:mRNA-degrading endonuclease HigB of HigAB toxin-antitoxin module